MSSSSQADTFVAFPTELGWMAVAFSPRGVKRLTFGYASKTEAIAALGTAVDRSAVPARGDVELVSRLQKYAGGQRDDFRDVPVDLGSQTAFRRRVYQLCRKIPCGKTLTYGELARRAGSPGGARAVGCAMAANQAPLIIPCHRVVPSTGGLGGFSAPGGTSLKQRLLDLESPASAGGGELD